jgi:hypothetical protein
LTDVPTKIQTSKEAPPLVPSAPSSFDSGSVIEALVRLMARWAAEQDDAAEQKRQTLAQNKSLEKDQP